MSRRTQLFLLAMAITGIIIFVQHLMPSTGQAWVIRGLLLSIGLEALVLAVLDLIPAAAIASLEPEDRALVEALVNPQTFAIEAGQAT